MELKYKAMEEIKYSAEYEGKIYNVSTRKAKRKDHKGYYKENGYIMRLVTEHPHANHRGYVAEHRLIIEKHLKRFLDHKELIHHIDRNRENNTVENLKVTTNQEHYLKEHFKGRNENGTFVCNEPIFNNIKYRLYDRDKDLVQIYTLNELMSKSFRRGKFEFRGESTGVKDIKENESYRGYILKNPINQWSSKRDIEKANSGFYIIKKDPWSNNMYLEYNFNIRGYWETNNLPLHKIRELEIVGNIYTDPDMIKKEE